MEDVIIVSPVGMEVAVAMEEEVEVEVAMEEEVEVAMEEGTIMVALQDIVIGGTEESVCK